MTSDVSVRAPDLIREELGDLVRLLHDLPAEAKRGIAFAAYEERTGELCRELILIETARKLGYSAAEIEISELRKKLLTEQMRQEAFFARFTRLALFALSFSAGGILVTALTHWGVSALTGMYSFWALGPLLGGVIYLNRRAAMSARHARSLEALREEITHSFGPSGEVLRPSEYYPGSTRLIEHLLDEIGTVHNFRK